MIRQFRTESYSYGSLTYFIQTELSNKNLARYRVFRINALNGEAHVVGDNLTLYEARAKCPGLVQKWKNSPVSSR